MLAFSRQVRKEHALFNISRIQQIVVFDLHASNILISVNYLPISSVAAKDFHFKENTERYSSTENTLYWQRIEMVNAP